ncbi:MAG: HAD family hydrolase [Alphaproteobacteria bacterium]|nr:HAD family hydrolase [Alphaproteobacteria bacterium]
MASFSSPPSFPIDSEGIWCEVVRPARDKTARPALFLDRDGVVIEEVHYLSDPGKARLVPGAAAIIAAANRQGVPVVLVTNQSGIGRGYYGWDSFAAVQKAVVALLAQAGAVLDAVYACPFHADGVAPFRHPDHPARKPNPGMMMRAGRDLRLDLARSWVVGDRANDLDAAKRAGMRGGVHVLTGHGTDEGERAKAQALADGRFMVETAPGIAEAGGLVPLLA